MSWGEIKKAVNDDMRLPLNKLMGLFVDDDGGIYYLKNKVSFDTLVAPYSGFFRYAYAFDSEPDKFHLLGDENEAKRGEYVYDNSTKTFTRVSSDMPPINNGSSIQSMYTFNNFDVIGDYVYFIGSQNGTYPYKGFYKQYKDGTWTKLDDPSFLDYSGGFSVIAYHGELHVLKSYDGTSIHYKYNVDTGLWTSVSTMPNIRFKNDSCSYKVCFVLNDKIHIVGTSSNSWGFARYENNGEWTILYDNYSQFKTLIGGNDAPYSRLWLLKDDKVNIITNSNNATPAFHSIMNSDYTFTILENAPRPFYLTAFLLFNKNIHIIAGTGNNINEWDVFEKDNWRLARNPSGHTTVYVPVDNADVP